MKILVTGGMGLIGHNIVAKLQDEHEICVIDNHTNYGFISQHQIDYLISQRMRKLKKHINHLVDISDIHPVNNIFRNFKTDYSATSLSKCGFRSLELNYITFNIVVF